MVGMSDARAELHWTADAQSASEASWVCWRLGVARGLAGACLFFFLCFGGLMVGLGRLSDPDYHVARGIVGAFLAALFFGAVLAPLIYFKTVRALKQVLGAGTELTAIWEPDSVVYRNPLAEVRYQLATIETVQVFQFWVAMRQTGTRRWIIWPRELFPETFLARFEEFQTA